MMKKQQSAGSADGTGMGRIAVVTGASRGIGKQVALGLVEQGWTVIAAARNEALLRALRDRCGAAVKTFVLDISSDEDCTRFAEFLAAEFPRIDALVNNAGVMGNHAALAFDLPQLHATLDTNLLGAIRVTRAAWPGLLRSDDARVINVSSGMGSMESLAEGGYAAYRLSKWSRNGWTQLLAAEAPKNISVFSICPGWVRTDMGGAGAPRSVEQGAETILWLADAKGLASGACWRDKERIDW
jgi:NAD(P)-dependent dehydrogenase (short-subunit alcohol dehydrogenase family)